MGKVAEGCFGGLITGVVQTHKNMSLVLPFAEADGESCTALQTGAE